MAAMFNLGVQEMIILVVGGLFCSAVVAGLGVLVFVLSRPKNEPRND